MNEHRDDARKTPEERELMKNLVVLANSAERKTEPCKYVDTERWSNFVRALR